MGLVGIWSGQAIATTNAVIVGALAMTAICNLLHVHMEALWALWECGLGMHVPGTISKSGVAVDLLAHLPSDGPGGLVLESHRTWNLWL